MSEVIQPDELDQSIDLFSEEIDQYEVNSSEAEFDLSVEADPDAICSTEEGASTYSGSPSPTIPPTSQAPSMWGSFIAYGKEKAAALVKTAVEHQSAISVAAGFVGGPIGGLVAYGGIELLKDEPEPQPENAPETSSGSAVLLVSAEEFINSSEEEDLASCPNPSEPEFYYDEDAQVCYDPELVDETYVDESREDDLWLEEDPVCHEEDWSEGTPWYVDEEEKLVAKATPPPPTIVPPAVEQQNKQAVALVVPAPEPDGENRNEGDEYAYVYVSPPPFSDSADAEADGAEVVTAPVAPPEEDAVVVVEGEIVVPDAASEEIAPVSGEPADKVAVAEVNAEEETNNQSNPIEVLSNPDPNLSTDDEKSVTRVVQTDAQAGPVPGAIFIGGGAVFSGDENTSAPVASRPTGVASNLTTGALSLVSGRDKEGVQGDAAGVQGGRPIGDEQNGLVEVRGATRESSSRDDGTGVLQTGGTLSGDADSAMVGERAQAAREAGEVSAEEVASSGFIPNSPQPLRSEALGAVDTANPNALAASLHGVHDKGGAATGGGSHQGRDSLAWATWEDVERTIASNGGTLEDVPELTTIPANYPRQDVFAFHA